MIGVSLFLRPGFWPVLLAVPILGIALWLLDRARGRRLERVLGDRAAALTPDLGLRRRRLRRWLAVTALAFSLLALLQPAWGEGAGVVELQRVDLVVCLDVSRSMLARDLSPDRLGRAKQEIRRLAEADSRFRLALVLFAGEAKLVVPFTEDLRSFADLADLASPLSIPRGGTDLGAAIRVAGKAFGEPNGRPRAIVLLTDGGDHEAEGLRAARMAAERGLTVHAIGFGEERGAKVPVDGAFLKDRAGQDVVTTLMREDLTRIADATGGGFEHAFDDSSPFFRLYVERILPAARETYEARKQEGRENRFQWPLLAGLVLWTLMLCVSEKRR